MKFYFFFWLGEGASLPTKSYLDIVLDGHEIKCHVLSILNLTRYGIIKKLGYWLNKQIDNEWISKTKLVIWYLV
jgi:hypothetical protein